MLADVLGHVFWCPLGKQKEAMVARAKSAFRKESLVGPEAPGVRLRPQSPCSIQSGDPEMRIAQVNSLTSNKCRVPHRPAGTGPKC